MLRLLSTLRKYVVLLDDETCPNCSNTTFQLVHRESCQFLILNRPLLISWFTPSIGGGWCTYTSQRVEIPCTPHYWPWCCMNTHKELKSHVLPSVPVSTVGVPPPTGTAIIDRLPQWCINRCNNWMIAPALVLFAGPYFPVLLCTFFVMIDTLAIVQADAIIG